jgi:hypothetical protein
VKIGEDDKGSMLKINIADYMQYVHNNVDDSPLYCFDKNFYKFEETKEILNDF